jgi:hypothetical protein
VYFKYGIRREWKFEMKKCGVKLMISIIIIDLYFKCDGADGKKLMVARNVREFESVFVLSTENL